MAGRDTVDDDPRDQDGGDKQVLVLVDPAFDADGAGEPPDELIVGAWPVHPDDTTGRFVPNPGYVPSADGLPRDPLDAALLALARGDGDGDEVLDALGDVVLSVAVDADGVATVCPAPDGLPSVLVTSSPWHRAVALDLAGDRVTGWLEVGLEEMAEALPESGLDVLLNPAAPASMRVQPHAIRAAATRAAALARATTVAVQRG